MTDMNRPDSGSRYTARVTPPATLTTKHRRMHALNSASTGCHCTRVSIHAPRKRPAARRRKKIEMLYVASAGDGPV